MIASSPHQHPDNSITSVMLTVIVALIPGIITHVWFFGPGLLINMCIAIVAGLATEAAILYLRKHPVKVALYDGSALVTAILFALTLPSLAPWWIPFIGIVFAMIFAKHLYGGLGQNPFNPAMVGYAMLLISFPQEMTRWLSPEIPAAVSLGLIDTLRHSFMGVLPTGINYDALSMATPLDAMKVQIGLGQTVATIQQSQAGMSQLSGIGWEWINIMFLLGGAWLIFRKIISFHIPAAMLAGLVLISGLFFLVSPDSYASPLFHLFAGATMLGAFFIATDPVTASTTPRGRIIYGLCIGILIYVIRAWGGYPDAIAFAVLIMNMAVPLIDYYTQPRVYGHNRSS
ncbi:MAG: electron transport complex subunit RsxD [Gammaproteobacteria bacterium]|nr:electron transport complex subunit RsxD [Gammaproteobacteria bacterium]MDH5776895.1 electron transport complex subunit RsxD [Gammaproteobacteria bacterium]